MTNNQLACIGFGCGLILAGLLYVPRSRQAPRPKPAIVLEPPRFTVSKDANPEAIKEFVTASLETIRADVRAGRAVQ